jgi:hypothetical protein
VGGAFTLEEKSKARDGSTASSSTKMDFLSSPLPLDFWISFSDSLRLRFPIVEYVSKIIVLGSNLCSFAGNFENYFKRTG